MYSRLFSCILKVGNALHDERSVLVVGGAAGAHGLEVFLCNGFSIGDRDLARLDQSGAFRVCLVGSVYVRRNHHAAGLLNDKPNTAFGTLQLPVLRSSAFRE